MSAPLPRDLSSARIGFLDEARPTPLVLVSKARLAELKKGQVRGRSLASYWPRINRKYSIARVPARAGLWQGPGDASRTSYSPSPARHAHKGPAQDSTGRRRTQTAEISRGNRPWHEPDRLRDPRRIHAILPAPSRQGYRAQRRARHELCRTYRARGHRVH